MKIAVALLYVVAWGLTVSAAPELTLSPTFENCSVTVKDARDVDAISLAYRVKGEPQYRPGMPLVKLTSPDLVRDWKDPRIRPAMPYQYGEFRGSLLHLKEDTEYEVAVTLQPAGTQLYGHFKTNDSRRPEIGRTIYLNELPDDRVLRLSNLHGDPNRYILLTVSSSAKRLSDENNHRDVVLELDNCSYLIIENVTFHGGNSHCLLVKNSHHIRIANCEFSGNFRPITQDLNKNGHYVDEKGRTMYNKGAVRLQQVKDCLIERCFIHSPRSGANSWFYSHPFGPMAIATGDLGGNVVIRYNDLAGSYLHHYDDVVGGGNNASPTGGFAFNADIYGNFFINSNDDSIELDGGQSNIRCYGNRMVGSFCGISAAPCIVGPSYIFGNLVHDMGDENGVGPGTFKTHFGDIGVGRIFYVGNTARGLSGGPASGQSDKNSVRIFSRNNVLPDTLPSLLVKGDIDHDLYDLKPAGPGSLPEAHGICDTVSFTSAETGNYRLLKDSPGTKNSVFLPNLWEYSQNSLGAYPVADSPELPVRPLQVSLDQSKLVFTAPDDLSARTLNMTSRAPADLAFEIKQSPDAQYFTVTPAKGVIKVGETMRFLVALHPEKMRKPVKYTDAFFIRFKDGLSRPVTVISDLRKSPVHLQADSSYLQIIPASASPDAGRFRIKADGTLSLPAADPTAGLTFEFSVSRPGIYFLFARFYTNGMEQNLFEFSVDNDDFKPCRSDHEYAFKPYSQEGWRRMVRSPNPDKKFEAFALSSGKHILKIRPVRPVQLRTIAISDDPNYFYSTSW